MVEKFYLGEVPLGWGHGGCLISLVEASGGSHMLRELPLRENFKVHTSYQFNTRNCYAHIILL